MANLYRPVAVPEKDMIPLTGQPAPQLIWAPISDLVIDDRYQRPLTPSNWIAIRRIAKNFQWSRFSPVVVAPVEGGRYAIIDGQHRAHAAAMCGVQSIPAMVAVVAPEEQALAFVQINTSAIRVNGHTVYRAALVAGEAWATDCRDAVEAAGCKLMPYNNVKKNDKKAGQVFAMGLIKSLIERGHAAAVTDGLAALLNYDRAGVANFTDTLLTPWLWACADTRAGRDAYATALASRRPWLVIAAADRFAAENRQSPPKTRRDFFSALIKGGPNA